MKKYARILALLFVSAALLLSFAVVSFAADGDAIPPYSSTSPSWNYDNTFDKRADGEIIYNANGERHGKVTAVKQDDGNVYALMEYCKGTGTTAAMWDITSTYSAECGVAKYPYFMIEFDIMTQNGIYTGTSLYTRLYNGKNAMNFVTQTSFNNIGLSTLPYEWQHVSVITRYNGDQTFTQFAYVNGVFAKEYAPKDFSTDAAWIALDGNYDETRVREIRFYPDASTTDGKAEVGLDNFAFTYFPTDYLGGDLDAIANYTYKNGDYNFPSKPTVATLTDNETGEVTYYDDMNKALADKNENNTLEKFVCAEIVHADGGVEYIFNEADFASRFSALPNGATIKLHKDMTITQALTFGGKRTGTLDLNGYKIYRLGTKFTDYQAVYNEETGKYEKGDALESPTAIAGGCLFKFTTVSNVFYLISSAPGAEIITRTITADRLFLDGEVVASTVTSQTSDQIFQNEADSNTVYVKGKNITTYSNSVVYAEHGSGTNFSFNIDGGTYIKTVFSTMGMFHILRGGTHEIKNAILVANGSYCGRTTTYNNGTKITFENCDIINSHTNAGGATDTIEFINCRLETAVGTAAGTVIFNSGVRTTNEKTNVKLAENVSLVSNVKTFNYSYENTIAIDPVTLLPYSTGEVETKLTLNCLYANSLTGWAEVTWKDYLGNVIKTERLLKGESVVAPSGSAYASVDGWRAPKITEWVDAEGNAFDLVITNEDTQVYVAKAPVIDESTEYAPAITEARLGFSYVSQFHMYVYLPVEANMARPTVTGYAPNDSSGQVLIDGRQYYCYTWWCGAATVSEDRVITVNFEIDGVSYSQNLTISAIIYAEIVLADPSSDVEANAVANMVRYIKEARKISGREADERIDKLIGSDDGSVEGLYTLEDYVESYPDDALDTSALSEYVHSFALAIKNGTPAYKIVFNEKGIDLKLNQTNVSISTVNGVKLDVFDYAKDGKTFETNNVKVYHAIDTLVVTVNVPAVVDAETGEVISEATSVTANYSIGTYIKGVEAQGQNVDLAKALYAFGLAVEEYRNSRLDY